MSRITLQAGQALGRYRLLEEVGAGGMGVVFRANDEHLQREVAIKVISEKMFDDPSAKRRFRDEAHALSRLNHPNIQTLYDFESQDSIDFLVVEFVPGISLDEKVRNGPLRHEQVVDLGKQLAGALIAAHEGGVVHRDLKLANLRLRPEGQLKILDFGLAKSAPNDPSNAATTTMKTDGIPGTPAYMAPEVLCGELARPVSDLYSVGVVLYELSTGLRPHRGSGASLIESILNRTPPAPSVLNPSIPAALEQVILKALEKRPEYRYQTARDLLVDLQRLGRDAATSSVVPAFRGTRSRFVAIAAGGLIILAAGYGIYQGSLKPTMGPSTTVHSLAVLPLKNLSPDPDQQYFAEAVTEELTSEFASLRALRVVSRTSASRYAGSTRSLPEIARELNVDAIMEGSVFRDGETARISLKLIDGKTDRPIWSERYERAADSTMSIQREIARAVVEKIGLTPSPAETQHLQSPRTRNPRAHEAYLRASYRLRRAASSEADADAAIQDARRAIALDNDFADAYVVLASALGEKIFYWHGGRRVDEEAFVAISRALALAPDLSEAYLVRGRLRYTQLHGFDLAGAVADYRKAAILSPNLAEAHHALGAELAHLGLHATAITELQTSIRLDPQLEGAKRRLARSYWQGNSFAEALETYRRHNIVTFEKGVVLTYMDRPQEARDALSLIGSADKYDKAAATALLLAREGKKTEAERQIATAIHFGKGKDHFHHAAFLIAAAYAEMADKKRALEWLRFAGENGMPNYPLFRNNLSMLRLHGYPGYERYIEELQVRWMEIVRVIEPTT
ncbi:MAG TPA: protein kinase [Terriglobales bacterium]|nr:protein kinase [Terriglobales bacterium]